MGLFRGYPCPVAEPDAFERWLNDFRKDVDAALSRTMPPLSPAAQEATRSFENWWQSSGLASSSEPAPTSGTLESTQAVAGDSGHRAEKAVPPDFTDRIERLARDRAEATGRASDLARENADLRGRQAKIESRLADFEATMSRSREAYESAVARLQGQVKLLEDHVKTLKEDKQGLEQQALRGDEALGGAREELRLERERLMNAERAAMEAGQRIGIMEAAVQKLREELAAERGAGEELRSQAATYRERLAAAKELTDSDIGALRQEMRMFLEEFRILFNTMRRERP